MKQAFNESLKSLIVSTGIFIAATDDDVKKRLNSALASMQRQFMEGGGLWDDILSTLKTIRSPYLQTEAGQSWWGDVLRAEADYLFDTYCAALPLGGRPKICPDEDIDGGISAFGAIWRSIEARLDWLENERPHVVPRTTQRIIRGICVATEFARKYLAGHAWS